MRSALASSIPNIFGGLGYLGAIIQWLWIFVLFLPGLLENQKVKEFLIPQASNTTTQTEQIISGNSVVMMIIAVFITLLVILVTLFILARLPLAIARASKKTVDSSVNVILPVVTHHKKLTKQKRELVSVRLKLYIKLAIAMVPLLLAFIAYLMPAPLETSIIIFAAAFLAIVTFMWFVLQYASARLLGVKLADLA